MAEVVSEAKVSRGQLVIGVVGAGLLVTVRQMSGLAIIVTTEQRPAPTHRSALE